MMAQEWKFSEARKWYFIATDMYNVIKGMVNRELKTLFDGKVVALFIDCYDLLCILFPKDMLFNEDHYYWNKTIWIEAFNSLHFNDNLKVCISPPSCLELFHFLERKAHYVYKGTPTITKQDEKNYKTFLRKLIPNQYALSLTQHLIDDASNSVPYLKKLKELISQKKIINASELFDYSQGDLKKFINIVSPNFDSGRAEEYLRDKRREYLRRIRLRSSPDILNLGLDSYAVLTDISNIAQTIYINSISQDARFTFASHGVYLILCCHKQQGNWKNSEEEAPVLNSLVSLYLAKALRQFRSYNEARDFFIGTKFAFFNYLHEFGQLAKGNSDLMKYIYYPLENSNLSNCIVKKTSGLMNAEKYIFDYCSVCLPGIPDIIPPKVSIGPTGIKDKEKIMEFAKNEELKKVRGKQMLDAARKSFNDLNILPGKVSDIYWPPHEMSSQLLLKLSGYSFSDWE